MSVATHCAQFRFRYFDNENKIANSVRYPFPAPLGAALGRLPPWHVLCLSWTSRPFSVLRAVRYICQKALKLDCVAQRCVIYDITPVDTGPNIVS